MSGFDNDWACPNHRHEGGRMKACPDGGCPRNQCARDLADYVERLMDSPIGMEEVHVK